MTEEKIKVAIVAGPNGSGKSTITRELQKTAAFPANYINADDIAANELGHMPDLLERNMKAAFLANQRRQEALDTGRSFSFETVLSTPGKLALFDEAHSKGFSINLWFVTTSDSSINIDRVRTRTLKKGHDVPAGKIIQRYASAMSLLPCAIQKSDYAGIYDNSLDDAAPLLVAQKSGTDFEYNDAVSSSVKDYLIAELRARLESRRALYLTARQDSIPDANIGNNNEYMGLVKAVTTHHVLQQLDDQSYVIHDRALRPDGEALAVGAYEAISYCFGPDGKHLPGDRSEAGRGADKQDAPRPKGG